MGKMAICSPLFASDPFLHAGHRALPVIPANEADILVLISGSPPPLSGTKEASSRLWHFILLSLKIPEEKMMTGPIIFIFPAVWFDVGRYATPPDCLFMLFERRYIGSAPISTRDAVIDSRHIRLAWVGDSNFAETSLSLTNNKNWLPKTNVLHLLRQLFYVKPISRGLWTSRNFCNDPSVVDKIWSRLRCA